MVADILGYYFGAFVYAFFMYYLVMWFVKILSKNNLIRHQQSEYAFIFTLIVTSILLTLAEFWVKGLVYHLPMVILVFLFDYRAAKFKKCPHCAEKINIEAKKCKHCHTILNEVSENDQETLSS